MSSNEAQVLVVDDESAIRDMIQFALRRAGMNVEGAANAKEAREKTRQGTDYREFNPHQAVIFICCIAALLPSFYAASSGPDH